MNSLWFLGVAVLFSLVGFVVLWLRQRKPTGVDAGIDAFRRELQALAPDERDPREDGGSG